MKKEYVGWLGVHYDDTGLYDTKSDAERCYRPDRAITDLLEPFDAKKVKITIETIDE